MFIQRNKSKSGAVLKRRKRTLIDQASYTLLLLCVPALIAYILFNYVPMILAVVIPFKNYKFALGVWGSKWSGLHNFKWLFTNASISRSLVNTLLYGLWFMIIGPITNAAIALLMFEIRNRKAIKTYQTIICLPNFMSMVIVGYITYAILSPRGGFFNQILEMFGKQPIDFYVESSYWPVILTIVNIWKGIGMGALMYYASLVGIDSSLYEAAQLDGATRWQRMRYISIPHLIPLVCIFTIMGAGSLVNGNFDLFYVIPRDSSILYSTTDILNTYVYRALAEGNYAMGATVGLLQSVAGMILVFIANVIIKKISPENAMF